MMASRGDTFGALGKNLLAKKLVFVTGKGGVGKSSVTAGLARLSSKAGLKTLVCEVDAKGDVSPNFGVEGVTFKPRNVAPNLYIMAMDTEEALAEYLRLNLRIPMITRLGPLARAFDFVANAAPGVKEILVVGKLCYEVRERAWDIIWVDASASGHIVSQLASPAGISELFKVGIVKEQTAWMAEILSNPETTSLVLVLTPEETPVSESLELLDRLRLETTIAVSMCVVNKVLGEPFSSGEAAIFADIDGGRLVGDFAAIADGGADALLSASRFATKLRSSRSEHTRNFVSALTGEVATVFVPFFMGAETGLKLTAEIAEALAGEMSGS